MFVDVYKNLLALAKEDVDREGLVNTPQRASKAMEYLLSGYEQNIDDIVNDAIFNVNNNNAVVLKNIDFYSLCEHHILPFWGKCSIGYIPNGKVIGLSKIPRLVNMYARRLQIQERLTEEIANALLDVTAARCVVVKIHARHMCMMMRGVERECDTYTECVVGDDSEEATLLLKMIN